MHKDQGKTAGPLGFWLPMGMAEHATAVGGIHLDLFCDGGMKKWGARQKVANNCLEMTVGQASPRLKRCEPAR
jgi:hypothetical protein